MVELETRGKEQGEQLQPPAALPRVWTSHFVVPLHETEGEDTAQQQLQEQQQQFETKGQVIVVDAGEKRVVVCSRINSHNQVRCHRTGSSHSGAEESPREETQTNQT